MELEEIFGFGFRCVMRWRCEGLGAALGTEGVRGVDILKVREGHICEHLSYVKG